MIKKELAYLEDLRLYMSGTLTCNNKQEHAEHLQQRIIQIDNFIATFGDNPQGAMKKICDQFSERKIFFENFIRWADGG